MTPIKTEALYQKDASIHKYTTTIASVISFSTLPAESQSLFKGAPENAQVISTPSTIFHVQGGGQPADTGIISSTSQPSTRFNVEGVRRDNEGSILHVGSFATPSNAFKDGESVIQEIDVPKRILNSRLHTAGHVLGLAVNILSKSGKITPDLVDGKASHYPGAASVEVIGLLPGEAKVAIQAKCDELVRQDLPIHIHFWSEEKATKNCLAVLDGGLKGDENGVRVVEIGDLGSYPCGGTHISRTSECGKINVRNIKRQKGISKIGYEVLDL